MFALKKNQPNINSRCIEVDVLELFTGIKTDEIKNIQGKRKFSWLIFLDKRNVEGELLAVISNLETIKKYISAYDMR